MKPILEIQHISKKFRIRHESRPYLSLRDSFTELFRSNKSTTEEFFALKDIHFDVFPGDTIGIVGKNGAGKSTLLKILSRITPPSSGKIKCRGRMASLLEVGTGFHPELSGRENIYFNGSILGMKKQEIDRNFDAIVDFSGVEKFLDTPLKHYSSGMQLRLAFAVAAFLENEILVIDEVLAVGDAEFQKKCLGKMDEVSKSGRTILFVSHHLTSVEQLCSKSIYLQNGQLKNFDVTPTILSEYLNEIFHSGDDNNYLCTKARNEFSFQSIALDTNRFEWHESVNVRIKFQEEIVPSAIIGYALFAANGTRLFSEYKSVKELNIKNGSELILQLPKGILLPGNYYFGFAISLPGSHNLDLVENTCHFTISDEKGVFPFHPGIERGHLNIESHWNCTKQ